MLGELSPRQSELALWWHRRPDLDGVIADGSIRSGKTVSMDAGFLLWSQANFSDCRFIVAGQSVAAANRNVVGPMKRIMAEDLGWDFAHNRGDNVLTVGSNEYHIFGAPNERSQDAIQGMTAAGCLLDEAALLPRSFIEQAVGRCSVDGAKIWLDCNPGSPSNYVKTDLIDMADEKRLLHLHFTLDDNPHLPESTKERYRRMFTGVFHDRYIRGLWVLAEGLVYQTPAEAYTCTDAKAADAKAAAGRAQSTADGAVTKATSAQATADGLKASVTKAQTTADSAVKAASSAQQTADAITATVSRDYLSKAGASQSYASKSSVTQTADGIRSEVASTYQTKAGMSAYAEKSYVDQKAGSITQSVEAVMATANGAASSASKANSDLAALSKMATKTYTFATANIKGKYWTRLGSLVSGGDWSNFAIEVMSGDGYNGSSSQNSRMTIVIKDGWQGKPAAYGAFGVSVLRENCQGARVAVMASAGNTCDVWVYLPWQYANGQYTISGAYRSWTQSVLSQADAPTSGVAQDVAYRLNAEQLKADVADTYTTKTEFRQTADAITATVAKKLDSATAASTYAKQSTLTQTADGLSVKVTTAQRTADAAKTAASTAKQTADGAANAANGAKAAADKAQTTAAGAVQKGSSGISSLETALTFDRDGLSIFKKVNGAIQGFIAKVTGSAFQICNKSGTVLSRFADNRIDLGRNSQDTTISMCRDNVRIYSSSKGGAGSGGEVNASYILCDAPVGANNRSSFSIGFGAFSSDPANDLPRETPYVTLGVDDARDGDSVTLGAQSVRVNGVDWTARHGQATGTGQYPNLARWACSGGLCTVSITHCLDGDLPSWASRTLATGLPRTAAQSWNLSCTQQLPDGTLRDLQVFVEPDNGSPQRSAKVTLAQKGGAGIPSGSWLFVSGTYPLAPDGDWYEPFG